MSPHLSVHFSAPVTNYLKQTGLFIFILFQVPFNKAESKFSFLKVLNFSFLVSVLWFNTKNFIKELFIHFAILIPADQYFMRAVELMPE